MSKDIYAVRILALKSGFFCVLVLNISTLVNENLLYYLTRSGKVIHINDGTVRKYFKKMHKKEMKSISKFTILSTWLMIKF